MGPPGPAGGGGGGATTALDNLAAVAINTSLISDADVTDDLGSAEKQWHNLYVQHVNLNATATLDGATAGKVNLTGNLSIPSPGTLGVGAAPMSTRLLNAAVNMAGAGYGGYFNVACAYTAAGTAYGLYGAASGWDSGGYANNSVFGLKFTALARCTGVTSSFATAIGCYVQANTSSQSAGGAITVASLKGFNAVAPSITVTAPSTTVITEYVMADLVDAASAVILNQYGLRINDCTAATGGTAPTNRILELGPTPYLRLLGSGSWAPAVSTTETPLYLVAGNGDNPLTYTVRQVKYVVAAAGGHVTAGDKVMVLV
jgi:hypothetical protein